MNQVISIEDCAKILNTSERTYSVDELRTIRDYLVQMAKLHVDTFLEAQRNVITQNMKSTGQKLTNESLIAVV